MKAKGNNAFVLGSESTNTVDPGYCTVLTLQGQDMLRINSLYLAYLHLEYFIHFNTEHSDILSDIC